MHFCSRALSVVPNTFGTRDWFHGRQFFHGLEWGAEGVGRQEAELRRYCELRPGTGRRKVGKPCYKWTFPHYACPIRKTCVLGQPPTVYTETYNFHVLEKHVPSCPLLVSVPKPQGSWPVSSLHVLSDTSCPKMSFFRATSSPTSESCQKNNNVYFWIIKNIPIL